VARGKATDIQNEAKELLRVRNYVNTVLSTATGQPLEKVILSRAWSSGLSYHEQLAYNILTN
jgi:ATP-dependent Clp protease protease subunit